MHGLRVLCVLTACLMAGIEAERFTRKFVCVVGDTLVSGISSMSPYENLHDQIPLYLCSHVIHAFVYPKGNDFLDFEMSGANDPIILSGSASAAVKINDPKKKFMLSIQGFGFSQQDFATMASEPENRAIMIQSLRDLANQGHIDGVDVHWLGPETNENECYDQDKEDFHTFLSELRAALSDQLISVTISPDPEVISAAYNLTHVARNANFINVATFDYHTYLQGVTGYHAPLYSSSGKPCVDTSMKYLLNEGVPEHKLVVGVSIRVQGYQVPESPQTAAPGTTSLGPGIPQHIVPANPGITEYLEVCQILFDFNPSIVSDFDAMASYFQYETPEFFKWCSYSTPEDLRAKGWYASANRLGGVMLWLFPTFDTDQVGICYDTRPFLMLNEGLRECPRVAEQRLENRFP